MILHILVDWPPPSFAYCRHLRTSTSRPIHNFFFISESTRKDVDVTYLIDVDGGLPELLVGLVEVTHTNLTEVTRVELVDVGTVVVLTTGHTATTGGLAVLADTTVTGRHMAAAARE